MNCTVRCAVLSLWLTCVITVFGLDLPFHNAQLSSVNTKHPAISPKQTANKVSETRNENSNGTTLSMKKNNAQRATITTLLDDELEINEGFRSTIPESAEWVSPNTKSEDEELTNLEQTVDNTDSIISEPTEDGKSSHEGSGDYDYPETTMDVIIGKTSEQAILSTTIYPETSPNDLSEKEQGFIAGSCFRIACNDSEGKTGFDSKIIVPESTNLTVTCDLLMNTTHQNISLYWYFINSTTFVFKDSSHNDDLYLTLNSVQKQDSGVYKCIRKSEQFCCNSEVSIIVYEIPNYKFHLVIVGAVAITLIAICILLSIVQTIQTRKYRNMENAKEKQEPLLSL